MVCCHHDPSCGWDYFQFCGEVLIAERPSGKPYAGYWEFPGGKIEPQETGFQALQRELKEELDIDVLAADQILEFEYQYPEKKVFLHVWKIVSYAGVPRGMEQQLIQWISLNHLDQVKFPEGNQRIVEKLLV